MKRRITILAGGVFSVAMASSLFAQMEPSSKQAAPQQRMLTETQVKNLGVLPFDKKINYVTVSPTGERLAYELRQEDQSYLICDGKPGPGYESVSRPVFSPNGQRLIYGASRKSALRTRRGRHSFLVCDGKELGLEYDRSGGPLFSPDSQRLAFQAAERGSGVVVCDGKEVYRDRGGAGWLVFSPNSLHLAFFPRAGAFVICDGKPLPAWESAGTGDAPVFSPDSRHLVYWARQKGSWFLVQAELRDDEWVVPREQPKGPTYEGFGDGPAFSPDGKHVACIAKTDGKIVMVLDGKSVGTGEEISHPLFSPDSERMAYISHKGKQWFIVYDGEESPPYDYLEGYRRVFSPDSKHLAYIGWRGWRGMTDEALEEWSRRGAKWVLVCDGRSAPAVTWQGGRYTWPQTPVFSPDSRHLAWFATRGKDQFVVVDGIEGPKHAFVRIPQKYCWLEGKAITPGVDPAPTDKNGTLRYVVGDGKEAWLVEVDWPKDLDWTNGLKPVEPEK